MTSNELQLWLEEEMASFPERASGEQGYESMIRLTAPLAKSERPALVGVLSKWLSLRSEPKTMLAIAIAATHGLSELRREIENILAEVRLGATFKPFYASIIEAKLAKLPASRQ